MPAFRGPPSYRLHRPSGHAVVTLQGRDHYLGKFGSTASRREYDRIVGEWLAAGRPTMTTPEPDQIAVVQVLAAFKRFAKEHYVKNGRRTRAAEKVVSVYRTLH